MELTPEQEKQIRKVAFWHMIKSFFMGVKYGFYFGLSVFLTALVNVYYVQSTEFPFAMGIVNMIFIIHFFVQEVIKDKAKLKEQIEKIINH